MRALYLFLLVFMPTVGAAQDLSEAEKAALSQRGLTPSEIVARRQGCRDFAIRADETFDVSTTIAGEIVRVRAFDVLLISQLVHDKVPGRYAIQAFHSLPNGGIGGKDFCGPIQLRLPVGPPKPGTPIQKLGLLLRDNLDLDKEYPNTSKTIWDENFVNFFAENWYVVLQADDEKVKKWLKQRSAAWMLQHGAREILEKDDLLYIPIKAPN